MQQAKRILMDARDAGGDKALLYRVWEYLRGNDWTRDTMTSVLDLNTGAVSTYSLPADEAVIAAYAQNECRDWNTWEYGKYRGLVVSAPSSRQGYRIVTCGNQTTLVAMGGARMQSEDATMAAYYRGGVK